MIRSPSGGSISSGSTNNSGTTKYTLNTVTTINNANNFSKSSTKDKEKTNSGRKGVTPSDGLDSQGWVILWDDYFVLLISSMGNFQEDEGVPLLGRIHWVQTIRVEWLSTTILFFRYTPF